MKKFAAILFLSVTSTVFACADFTGDYVCEDKFSYRYYRHISISEEVLPSGAKGLTINEDGRNRYDHVLRLNGEKFARENAKIKSSCSGKTIKVTLSLGRYSETETFKLNKEGLIFTSHEENGKKRLNCKKI